MRRIAIGLVLLVLAGLGAACTALPGGARVAGAGPAPPAGPLFRGLTRPLDGETQPTRRYIFHIHGMGPTDEAAFHNDLFILLVSRYGPPTSIVLWQPAMLATPMRVGSELLDCDTPWVDHLHPTSAPVIQPCNFPSFGSYRIDVFSKGGQETILYTYFWHRDLWRIQEPMLRSDMQRHAGKPAFLNSYLKHDTLDAGISDATAYVGPAGDLVRAGISSVLCTMKRDAAAADPAGRAMVRARETNGPRSLGGCNAGPSAAQFAFVTHSLGSRMLYDVLAPRQDDGTVSSVEMSAERREMIKQTDVVYMAANQLPLLALGRVKVAPLTSTRGPAPPDFCKSQSSLLEARRRADGRDCSAPSAGRGAAVLPGVKPETALQIVAFADPDDILGYVAGDAAPPGDRAEGRDFIDISHRNTGQFAWSIVLPNLAHDRELKRRDTQDMILCGAEVTASGRVKPYPCPRTRP